MSNRTRITIDPGIRGTGIAVWDFATWRSSLEPLKTYVFTPPSEDDWVLACSKLFEDIETVFDEWNVCDCYCEFPQYFSAGKGHAATAKGDILKLACFVGMLMGSIFARGVRFTPVYVNTWKGQLPKEVVIKRILKINPELSNKGIDSHAWDAVGIGLYLKGKLNSK